MHSILCKVHKQGHPLRPVVSMVGTSAYGLAKYLDKVIKPFIPSTYMVSSTSSFIEKVKNFVFGNNDVLVSFDVVSLFTNVPLSETIDLITNYIYSSSNQSKPPFTKRVFKNLLKLATGGYFAYNGKLYTQTDGVMMGSPLGPTLANFFLAHLESTLLSRDDLVKPKLYLRYVDDIFAVFSCDNFMPFFDALNQLHPNIKFTFELGNSSIAFLDTYISVADGQFTSNVYRKVTNTNVLLNALAVCPEEWKRGIIYCFLHRAWTVCSSRHLFNLEVSKLIDIFTSNGYTLSFVKRIVHRFVTKKETGPTNSLNDSEEEDEPTRFVMMIPFAGKPSLLFKRQISKIFKDKLDVELRCVFQSFRVSNYFSLKSQSAACLLSNVVYKFTCLGDPSRFYIGETKCHIVKRVSEHVDFLNPNRLPTAIGSHIRDNCADCLNGLKGGALSYKNFDIIDQCKSKLECEVKEAFHIKRQKPALNRQLHQSGASLTLKLFN